MGASSDGVAAAYRLLDAHGLDPYMDVCLWIQPDGRFSVEPTAMWSEPGDLAASHQVDDILVDSGRPRERLRQTRNVIPRQRAIGARGRSARWEVCPQLTLLS